ncbi:Wzz/FepE/Etk N-terminal domain-containing protein [Candidatus Aminicenantes bacterium AC-334-K16]|nr:Wzz/FepE/Etk N-terminal domain-containing protein [Candidatus Aminicenantes bacterium AC-334-K16]
MDYIAVLWKRKWLIIIPTFLLIVAAGILSFLLPKKWEISAIIQPAKFLVQTEGGRFEEVLVASPVQIAGQINEEAFNQLIASELNIALNRFPEIKAQNLKNTNLVKISLTTPNIKEGQEILYSLFTHLKRDLDRKIDVEIQNLDTQKKELENKIKERNIAIKDKGNEIQTMKNEIKKKEEEIRAAQNKIRISEERVKNIITEMKKVKSRIEEISEHQKKALAQARKKGEGEAISLLLYSNEVQQNLRYYNILDEQLSDEKIIQEDLKYTIKRNELDISNMKTEIKKLENDISKIKNEIETLKSQIILLEDEKNRIDYAQLIKDPTPSLYPVSPKKKLIVAIAGILGLMGFTFLAFFIDYIERNKSRLHEIEKRQEEERQQK